ncbi:MAG: hypothetical protein ACYTEW_24625 [Planctomycetota bacterium]
MDYGTVHWNVIYLLARLGQNIYVVDELANRRRLAKQNAIDATEMLWRYDLQPWMLRAFPAGHDVFAERGTEKTIAQVYYENGITLTRANINRINGAGRIRELLGNPKPEADEIYIEPRLYIFKHCRRLIETLPEMQHDPARGEDVLKVDCDPDTGEGGDDPYDSLRHGVMEDVIGYGRGVNPLANYRG